MQRGRRGEERGGEETDSQQRKLTFICYYIRERREKREETKQETKEESKETGNDLCGTTSAALYISRDSIYHTHRHTDRRYRTILRAIR